MLRRTAAAVAVTLALLVGLALPAGAHVELEPSEAVAGSTATLGFSFRHGKDGAPTTALSVQVPDGAAIVEVPPKDGWIVDLAAEDTIVTWSGGSVPDGIEATFDVVVRLPETAGVALFPTIQTTGAGELAWISADEGESEDDHPAPRLVLTPGQATSSSSSSVADGSTTTQAPRDRPRTILEIEERDDGGSSALPWIVSGVAALAAIGIGGTILSRRMRP